MKSSPERLRGCSLVPFQDAFLGTELVQSDVAGMVVELTDVSESGSSTGCLACKRRLPG